MLKKLIVVLALVVCCYCDDNNELLTEETRAKKKKRSLRLLAMIALFIFSKLTVMKIASFFFFLAFFQKLFSLGGIFLGYLMRNQAMQGAMYGAPEYNTLGYNYGPENEQGYNNYNDASSYPDFSGALNWFMSKQQ